MAVDLPLIRSGLSSGAHSGRSWLFAGHGRQRAMPNSHTHPLSCSADANLHAPLKLSSSKPASLSNPPALSIFLGNPKNWADDDGATSCGRSGDGARSLQNTATAGDDYDGGRAISDGDGGSREMGVEVEVDGEVYNRLAVGANGLPVLCNAKGCRPFPNPPPPSPQQDARTLAQLVQAYYENLFAMPSACSSSLLLRDFAQFLYTVQGDHKRAEEYYGRAILSNSSSLSPSCALDYCEGDGNQQGHGKALSEFAGLLWKEYGNKERAESYFERAVQVAPEQSEVLASYASFLWETEE